MEEPSPMVVLAPVAAALLDRHTAMAQEWFPHQLVPWDRGRALGDPSTDEASALRVTPGVSSALIVNLLTEDNLPFYVAGLIGVLGTVEPWWDWVRRWTAEEMRHGTVIRDYLSVVPAVDLVALERARMAHVMSSAVPSAASVLDAFVYLALQELSTRIAHRNTGRCLGDEVGRQIMSRVAADENLHFLFYRDLVAEAAARDPSAVVIAIESQVRHFAMPGARIPGYAEHAAAIADAGIFSASILLEQVFVPVVVRQWRLEELGPLSDEAERARDRTLRFFARFGRVADRLSMASVGSATANS